jgi:hypothetical protein
LGQNPCLGKESGRIGPRVSLRKPRPFDLTITIQAPEGPPAQEAYHALRSKVLQVLNGTLWKPLEPQSVSYVKVQGRFPAAYQFDCDLSLAMIQDRLEDADFWCFESRRHVTFGVSIEGRIPFRLAGKPKWNYPERIRITGDQPNYTIEVGIWRDEPDRTPTCEQIHKIVQSTILPAIGARNLRPKP